MSKDERTDGVYLLHIASAMQDVQEFLEGKDYSEFAQSKLLINAVVRSCEIMGEATKNLTEAFRAAHADIEWKGMAGFRDVLIHQYFGIDLENVWDVYANFIPANIKKITALPEYQAMAAIMDL